MNPKTEEDFKEFGSLLKDRILQYQQSDHYVNFLDELFKACSLDRKYLGLRHYIFHCTKSQTNPTLLKEVAEKLHTVLADLKLTIVTVSDGCYTTVYPLKLPQLD